MRLLHVESDERAVLAARDAAAAGGVGVGGRRRDAALCAAHLAGMAPVVAPTTAAVKLTYQGPPVVASIAPDAGPVDGATEVALRGAGPEDVTRVTLGGSNCINPQFTPRPRAAAANGSEELGV